MNYLRLETEICDLLQHHGWIERIERNRQDRFIDWTPLGRERGTRFVDEVRVLWPKREWTDEELAYLRSFGIYEGFIKATRRDRTIAAMKLFIECRNLIVVSLPVVNTAAIGFSQLDRSMTFSTMLKKNRTRAEK